MNFIERNGKKIAIALCFATCVPVVSAVYAFEAQPGWHGEGEDRYYVLETTREQAKGWLHLDDGTYYFDENGDLVFGWQTIDSTNTITGRVAFIGPTIVIGRFFIPKYPNIHDERTITDFNTT